MKQLDGLPNITICFSPFFISSTAGCNCRSCWQLRVWCPCSTDSVSDMCLSISDCYQECTIQSNHIVKNTEVALYTVTMLLIITPLIAEVLIQLLLHGVHKKTVTLYTLWQTTSDFNKILYQHWHVKWQTSHQISVKLVNICNSYSKFSKVTQMYKCPL